jgi:hypothetical protein
MTTTTPAVAETAATADTAPTTALDRAVSALCQADSNLDNVAAVLRELGKDENAVGAPTAGRVRALCWFLAKQLSERWDAETRSAPPNALAEVVRDVLVHCAFEGCLTYVAPWQHEFCSTDCEVASMAARGETRVGA